MMNFILGLSFRIFMHSDIRGNMLGFLGLYVCTKGRIEFSLSLASSVVLESRRNSFWSRDLAREMASSTRAEGYPSLAR